MSRPARVAVGAALLLCSLAGYPGQALAQDSAEDPDEIHGHFGLVVVARNNLGTLGGLYHYGFLWGLHAGLEQPVGDSDWQLGVDWTTLVRGYYFESESSQVESIIELSEFNVGVTLRRTLRVPGQHVVLSGGGDLILSNRPIPPANDRRYLGWYAGLGFDRRLFGEWSGSIEARYSRLEAGIANISLLFGMTAGL